MTTARPAPCSARCTCRHRACSTTRRKRCNCAPCSAPRCTRRRCRACGWPIAPAPNRHGRWRSCCTNRDCWRAPRFSPPSPATLLAEAREASLPLARLEAAQQHYARGGGTGQLSDYFQAAGPAGAQRFEPLPQLGARIIWAQYNLVTDASFNEFQLIVCRRALPDFGPLLRQRVLQLFHASLAPFGVLGLDRVLDADDALAAQYQPLLPELPWYKRTA